MQELDIEGVGTLRLIRYHGHETINGAFEFELWVSADDVAIALSDGVGKVAHLRFGADDARRNHIHGIVRRFEHSNESSDAATYRVVVVPEAWRMRLRKNTRIFQQMTVVDILTQVLGDADCGDFQMAASGSYATREYTVQYRESDWQFINRLMEEEGIYYFFEHDEGSCTMVVGDTASVHESIAGDATLKFRAETGALDASLEHVHNLNFGEEVVAGKVTMRDYNFKTPALSLESSTAADVDDDLEIYDYPGNYADGDGGSQLATMLLESHQARRKTGSGASSCARMASGRKFTLEDSPRDDLNIEYLLVRIEHRGADPLAHQLGDVEPYNNKFWIMPADVPFRPERRTPKPTINGIQTAVVTGPGGEEIHTDEHGRIKVQFHWDREGAKDENSSCWVRVKQPWAGPGWGSLWIPRIGQEVVIDFIEGDPDRPLCSGAVYHAANPPPYSLPDEKTKSTIKSDSSIGGGGFNELRFEDKAGSEEIFLHGQKDWNVVIENDENQEIGHDETRHVVNDQTLDVDHDQTITIGNDRHKTVKNDQFETVERHKRIDVTSNHDETIGGDATITIKGGQTLSITGDRSVSIDGEHEESVDKNQTITITKSQTTSVGEEMSLSVTKGKSEEVGEGSTEEVGGDKTSTLKGNYELTVKKDATFTVEKNFKQDVLDTHTLISGKKFAIQCGDATVEIAKDGKISIFGKDITVKGEGTVKVEGKKLEVDSKGAVNLNASGKVKVKGSNVELN